MVKRKKPRKGFKRSRKEWEKSIAGHIGKFIDRLSAEDVTKLAMFGVSTYVLKELKLIRWEAYWEKPTPRQETLNWLTNAMAAYLIVYKPEAITGIIRPLLKLPAVLL